LSRLRIPALLATLAILATAFAACGGSGGGSGEDPQKVLDDATLAGIKSGDLDLSVHVTSEGGKSKGGDLSFSASGPFKTEGKESLPQLDVEATAHGTGNGRKLDFEGGLTVLADKAYVNYQGTEYEVDPTTFGFVKSSLEQSQGGSKGGGGATACQKAAEGLKVSEFVDDLKNEGSADVDGTSTTKVSGSLNVGSAVDTLIKLTENAACSAQLKAAGPLPLNELEEAKGELSSSIQKSHVDVYVGDDDIVRRIVADLTIAPQGSGESIELELDLSIGGVNEEQRISAPSGPTKPLQSLFQKLNINPLELLEAGSGGSKNLLNGFLEGLAGEIGGGALGGSLGGGGSSSGGGQSSSGGGSNSSSQKAYLECLQGAKTPADLQNCASLIH
jgi:hypothetical protein